ncbi:unnamed protein product [Moneuplotes crassus]|uniref:Uncharacterized protein n=1 Tax=Euplotes crassus TaxID=5936 RepID=A0AAD1X3T0_EUPCR|nr:unnamed protein product [Moneuplotes crassus]
MDSLQESRIKLAAKLNRKRHKYIKYLSKNLNSRKSAKVCKREEDKSQKEQRDQSNPQCSYLQENIDTNPNILKSTTIHRSQEKYSKTPSKRHRKSSDKIQITNTSLSCSGMIRSKLRSCKNQSTPVQEMISAQFGYSAKKTLNDSIKRLNNLTKSFTSSKGDSRNKKSNLDLNYYITNRKYKYMKKKDFNNPSVDEIKFRNNKIKKIRDRNIANFLKTYQSRNRKIKSSSKKINETKIYYPKSSRNLRSFHKQISTASNQDLIGTPKSKFSQNNPSQPKHPHSSFFIPPLLPHSDIKSKSLTSFCSQSHSTTDYLKLSSRHCTPLFHLNLTTPSSKPTVQTPHSQRGRSFKQEEQRVKVRNSKEVGFKGVENEMQGSRKRRGWCSSFGVVVEEII